MNILRQKADSVHSMSRHRLLMEDDRSSIGNHSQVSDTDLGAPGHNRAPPVTLASNAPPPRCMAPQNDRFSSWIVTNRTYQVPAPVKPTKRKERVPSLSPPQDMSGKGLGRQLNFSFRAYSDKPDDPLFSDWLLKVEKACKIQGIPPREFCYYLPCALDSAALAVYEKLTEREQLKYDDLVRELEEQFRPRGQAPVYRAKLRNCKMKKHESVRDFLYRFETIAKKTCPNNSYEDNPEVIDTWLADLYGENHSQLACELNFSVPRDEMKTLSDAVRAAKEVEAKLESTGGLASCKYRAKFLDEAGQLTIPEALVVMTGVGCAQCILVGDHLQLPPTVLCKEAKEKGLAVSVFARYVHLGVQPIMLTVQYRMTAEIAEFVSKNFYRSSITSAAPWAHPSADGPMGEFSAQLIDLKSESVPDSTESCGNIEEVKMATLITQFLLLRWEVPPDRVGILAPYRAQRADINRHIARNYPGIRVSTIDGYQGGELDYIILSLTLARTPGGELSNSLGFLCDARRINVALSRAKFGLFIIGDFRALLHPGNNIFTGLYNHHDRANSCFTAREMR